MSPQTVQVTLPELGSDALEAIVVAWERRAGDSVEQGEPICLVATGSGRAAVESPATGTVSRLLADLGTHLEPGASLAEIEVRGAASDALNEPVDGTPQEAPERNKPPVDAERQAAFEPLAARAAAARPARRTIELRSFHSPAVRRLAAIHRIDLALVRGHGIGGRIRKEDVVSDLEDQRRRTQP